jgi:hypothetical protein
MAFIFLKNVSKIQLRFLIGKQLTPANLMFCPFLFTLLFWNILTQKNKHSLILPSHLSIYLSAPKTKIIFQFLWGILEGRPNRARPSQPILKNCQNGTFLSVDEIWNFFVPNDLIWSTMKAPFFILPIMCLRLRPCAYPCG